jgi:outer membrane protein assembly factor BamA
MRNLTFRAVPFLILFPVFLLAISCGSVLAAGAPDQGGGFIEDIRFEGNDRTRPQTMLQEMLVRKGDPADMHKIERSRQAIMDLELFQWVKAELKPGEKGKILLIRVKEKHYWLVFPTLSRNADGDITYGGEVRFDNLFGMNQQLKANYKIKDFSDNEVDERRTSSLEYYYPRIKGGPYAVDIEFESQESDLDAMRRGLRGQYRKDSTRVEFDVIRWLRLEGPSRGWRATAGLLWNDLAYEYVSGVPGLFKEGTIVAARLGADYLNVHNHLYSRSGAEYGYNIEIAHDGLGSDEDYTKHEAYYRRYMHVGKRPHTNLNVQVKLGMATDDLLGEPFFSLGGGSSIRGYDRDSMKGNAFIQANVEYLRPLLRKSDALRGVVFVDAGNTYEKIGKIDLADLNASAGVGIRWTIKTFVRLTLRLDAAYAFDTNDTKYYAGSSHTF